MHRIKRRLLHSEGNSGSQESRPTSTPVASPQTVSLSPSISDIGNEEVPMEIDSEVDDSVADPTAASEDIRTLLSESVFEESKTLKKPKTIKFTGFWSSLKPKDKDSLYYKIMNQPDEIESIVGEVLHFYQEGGRKGVISILQLFVDLCGYKKLSLNKVYNFEQLNAKEVVEKMEGELMETDLKKTGKFLFVKCSNFESIVTSATAEFLKHLVFTSFHNEILFDKVLLWHVLEFINCMTFSMIRCIRVTGVILAIKCLTAFVKLHRKIFSLMHDENSNSTVENANEKESQIEKSIDFLYIIFERNCFIPDKKSYVIKVKCAQEMYQWIEHFADIFILKRKCLGRLMKFVVDTNDVVRLSALTTCEKMIRNETIEEVVRERIDLCLKIVSTRFVDSNYNVAIKAVKIFTAALERYSEHMANGYKLSIIYRMYEKKLSLAKVAGEFLVTYLKYQNDDEEQFLLSLVRIAYKKKEFAERIPFFVESCIEFIPELTNWNLVINIILNNEFNFEARKHLIHVFNEVVKFSLTGKFSQSRQGALEERTPTRQDHIALINALIPNFEAIVVLFQTDKNCVRHLIEILTFINYEADRSQDLRKHYLVVFTLLKDLFGASTDKSLLENIVNAFSCFCEKLYYNRADIFIEKLRNSCVKTLKEDLQQLTPTTSEKVLLLRLRETSMKLSIISRKFDITNILKWEEIFQVWDNNYFKALKYLIVCCKWHLVWSLHRFIRSSTASKIGERVNRLLYNNCKDFVYGCLDMLQRTNGSSESFLIFETLCDLYVSFEKELKRNRGFSDYFLKIAESDCQEILMKFAVYHVIENAQLDLEERQKLLSKLVDVIYLGVIPVEHFSKMLRYYHSHNEQFGVIINGILSQLHLAHPGLPVLIMHTLAQRYEQIKQKYQVVNIMSDESKQLKFLTKRFTTIKEMKSTNDILKLIQMSICFAFKSEQNYQFLYFARYFAKLLNEGAKSDAYHLFTEMVPEKDKGNDILLLFANVLKPSK